MQVKVSSIMKKNIITISGIRPDFIRMSTIFKKLDENFNHTLIHTGQHYDNHLSGVFFDELNIRKPDYFLETGKAGGTHYYQLSYLSTAIIDLIKDKELNPDIILFLGDSNSVCAALPLRKEGYIIGHIEAGMRSYDKRMLEEINRIICDHCSHILFVYHDDYRKQVNKENIKDNVHVVGNTIVEVSRSYVPKEKKRNNMILVDIHRPENYKYKNRLQNIIKYANECSIRYNLPIKMIKFFGTCKYLKKYNIDLGDIELIEPLSYKKYLNAMYHSKFIISDSGTGQEEPAIFGTPVIVPRDFTERPQSIKSNCSFMLKVKRLKNKDKSFDWLDKVYNKNIKMNTKWLGEGNTSDLIIQKLKEYLNKD